LNQGPINADIVIVPNFGGWGNVPLNQAIDLEPVISGVQQYLESLGLQTIVAPYRRVPAIFPEEPDFDIKLAVITEMLGLHHTRARHFARILETLALENSNTKFLLLGLSNGAGFIDNTMEYIAPVVEDRVAAVAIGIPFWHSRYVNDNIIHLDNGGNDPVTQGKVEDLFGEALRTIFLKFYNLVNGRAPKWEEGWRISGHEYKWEEIRPVVIHFINHRLLKYDSSLHH
jgi:hypothetical protein